MKSTRFFLQAAVVASAVLLVGGFVGYRAGAFPWLTETVTPPAAAGSAADRSASPATADRTIMPSYKAGIFIDPGVPHPPAAQPAQTGETPPVFIGGSKSAIFPLFPPPPSETQPPQAEPPPAQSSR